MQFREWKAMLLRKLLLCVFFCVVSGQKAMQGKIGILVRLHGPSGLRLGDSWDRVAGAAVMAVNHVNNRDSTLVPEAKSLIPEGFRIDYEMADTFSDARHSIEIALRWASTTLSAIVGAYRSAVSGPVALVADTALMPVLSWGSTSTALSDTISYRMFGRTIPSDAVPALACVRICAQFGWSKIAVLFVDDAYGRGYAQDITAFAGQYGVEVATAQKFFAASPESVQSAVKNIKTSLARIIMCIAFEGDMDQIVFSAAREGILGEGFVWLTTDGIVHPNDVVSNSNNPREMARGLTGWLRLSVGPFVGKYGEQFQEAWKGEPAENKMDAMTSQDPAVFEKDCGDFCGFMYDAVWAMAIAISRTDTALDFSVPGDQLVANLRGLSYEGATGPIRFLETGDRDPETVPIIIRNFAAEWAEDGSISTMTNEVKWTWEFRSGLTEVGSVPPVWPGGNATWIPPQDGSSCPAGFEFSATRLACVPCVKGSALHGGLCLPCPVGSVAPFDAMSQCIPCSDGYADQEGMAACKPCPPNSQRKPSTPGNSSLECECNEGYYAKNGLGQGCDVCITGGICEGGDMQPYPMVTDPRARGGGAAAGARKVTGRGGGQEGFWGDRDCKEFRGNISEGPGSGKDCPYWDKFIICAPPALPLLPALPPRSPLLLSRQQLPLRPLAHAPPPLTQRVVAGNPNWNCLGGKEFECEQGRRGNICQKAKPGYFIIGGSFWNPCGENGAVLTVVYIAIVVTFWFIINHFASQKYHALNIALLFVQILAIVGMFNMKWPEDLDYLNIALSVANFDVDFVTPHCVGRWSLVASFYLQLLLPWVFGIARSLFMSLRQYVERRWRRQSGPVVWHSSLKQIMSFVVTMYATLSIKCFQVFRCEQYPDGKLYLWFAPEVECWQPSHVAMVVTASLYIPVVLVGTPVFVWWVVRTHQREGSLHHPKVVRKWAWVHDAFEAQYKYWEVLLLIRRFSIALIAGLIVEPMVQGALSIIVLTGLLAAHVFSKPYIRDDIDVMDFVSIIATMLYVLAGLLIFPNVTEKAQGRVCASDADEFLRDEAQYCDGEERVKGSVGVLALVTVMTTLLFSFAITFRQIRHTYYSASASKIVLERCKALGTEGDDAEEAEPESLNQVELDEIFQGTWLHAWARRIRERATRMHSSELLDTSHGLDLQLPETAGSRTLIGSPESFYRINGAIRDLDEDITEFSASPLAIILRQLCKIPGMIEYLAWKGPEERKTLLHFVKEMAEFETLAEEEPDPFPLTQLVVDEHRPVIAYFLMTCRPSLIHKFFHLTDAILESNGHKPRTHRRVLRLESRHGLDTMGSSTRSQSSPPAAAAFGMSVKNLGAVVRKSILGKGREPDGPANVDSIFVGRTHSTPDIMSRAHSGGERTPSQGGSFKSIRTLGSPALRAAPDLPPPAPLDLGNSPLDLSRILAWLPEPAGEDLRGERYVVQATAKRKIPQKLIRRAAEGSSTSVTASLNSFKSMSSTSDNSDLMSQNVTSLKSEHSVRSVTQSEGSDVEQYTEQWVGLLDANAAHELHELEDIEEGEEGLDSRRSLMGSAREAARSGGHSRSKRRLSIENGDIEGFIKHVDPPHARRDPNSPYTNLEPARASIPEASALSLEIRLEAPHPVLTSPPAIHLPAFPPPSPSLADQFLRPPAPPPPPAAVLQDDNALYAQLGVDPCLPKQALASPLLAAASQLHRRGSAEIFAQAKGDVTVTSELVQQNSGADPVAVNPSDTNGIGPGPLPWPADLQTELASWTPDDHHRGGPAMV